MDNIDKLIKEEKRQSLIKSIKESRSTLVFILIIILVLSWSIYRNTDTVVENTVLNGTLVGIHQLQENDGSTTTKLSIELDNGNNVLVATPINFTYKNNAKVEINMVKTEQNRTYYSFICYESSQ